MRTKYLEIHERSRLFKPSDAERFALRLEQYGSQEELEKVREFIFKMKQEGA